MYRSSQKFPWRSLPALALFAGLLASISFGCARSSPENQVQPLAAAPQDQESTASGTSSQEIRKRDRESLASLLQGRTSGVDVRYNNDGTLSVRIRGPSSFYGGSAPLYVIDDVPVEAPGGRLAIDPYDIESIRVLKGPPETTLYGVRGANGVVIIKTKKRGG